jgi:hypothetical protein
MFTLSFEGPGATQSHIEQYVQGVIVPTELLQESYGVIRPAHPPPGARLIFNFVPRFTWLFTIL